MKLAIDPPEDHKVIDLAPRVEGVGRLVGCYGYALCLVSVASMAAQEVPGWETATGGVRVLWDDDTRPGASKIEDVDVKEIFFITAP